MEYSTPQDLISLLRKPVLRVRTGLLLVTLDYLGKERDLAARFGVEAIDINKLWLQIIPQGSNYSGLDPQSLKELLSGISGLSYKYRCLMIYNFDLVFSCLKYNDRNHVWNYIFNSMPNRRNSLLILIQDAATDLIPTDNEFVNLNREKRIAKL